VSLQLQRFFQDSNDLFEGIKMRSVVISYWDEGIKDNFNEAMVKLERSWRCGHAFAF
jgi:hypothetical protein